MHAYIVSNMLDIEEICEGQMSGSATPVHVEAASQIDEVEVSLDDIKNTHDILETEEVLRHVVELLCVIGCLLRNVIGTFIWNVRVVKRHHKLR